MSHTDNSEMNVQYFFPLPQKYRIRPNYRTYSYKRTVKQFRSLKIIGSVIFVYFFIKAYVVGTHLKIQMSSHNICVYKENQKNCIINIK